MGGMMKHIRERRFRATMYQGPANLPCALIQLCDSLVVLGAIPVLLLACWAGLWKIMDIFIFPKDKELTGWPCLAIGISLLLILNFFQKILYDTTRNSSPLLYGFIWRIHAYVALISAMTLWRGVWKVIEFYTGKSALSMVIGAIVAAVVLIPLRVFNVVITVPGRVVRETVADPFRVHTRFNTVPSCTCTFVLDVALNVVIAVVFVIYFRGLYDLMEKIIYPGDKVRNLWACMMLGYSIVVMCIIVQRYVVMLYRALKDRLWLKIALEDSYTFVIAFGAVNVWRGWWLLYDVYLLASGDKVLKGALLHVAGVLMSYLLCSSRALSFPLSPDRLDGELNCKTDNVMGMYLEDKECCCFEPFHVTDDTTITRPKDKPAEGQKAEDVMLLVTEEETKRTALVDKDAEGYGTTPEQ